MFNITKANFYKSVGKLKHSGSFFFLYIFMGRKNTEKTTKNAENGKISQKTKYCKKTLEELPKESFEKYL